MKNIKKKIWALMSAAVTTSALVVSMTGSSVTTVRDADGDGRYTGSDATLTLRYLKGEFNPSSVRSFDFDGNGIISYVDALKVLGYYSGSFNDDSLPGPVGADSTAVATTRTYVRHYYGNAPSNAISEYSLTVNPLDNTASSTNAYSLNSTDLPGVVLDNDAAVVDLTNGSGFIVSDHVIATAAHCVYDGDTSSFINNYEVIIFSNGARTIYSPTYVDIPKTYYINPDIAYDYALIYVEEDLSQYGMFELGLPQDEYIDANGEVTISGFPNHLPGNEDNSFDERFKSTGNITGDFITTFVCDAFATNGDSGGPVYVSEEFNENEYNTVIAIFVGKVIDNITHGLKMNHDMLKFYNGNPYIDY